MGPGQKVIHQALCHLRNLRCQRDQLLPFRDMKNQRIVRRPSLGCINLTGSFRIQSISSQPVYSLCRKGDKTAVLQYLSRFTDHFWLRVIFIYGKNFRIHKMYYSILAFHIQPKTPESPKKGVICANFVYFS